MQLLTPEEIAVIRVLDQSDYALVYPNPIKL